MKTWYKVKWQFSTIYQSYSKNYCNSFKPLQHKFLVLSNYSWQTFLTIRILAINTHSKLSILPYAIRDFLEGIELINELRQNHMSHASLFSQSLILFIEEVKNLDMKKNSSFTKIQQCMHLYQKDTSFRKNFKFFTTRQQHIDNIFYAQRAKTVVHLAPPSYPKANGGLSRQRTCVHTQQLANQQFFLTQTQKIRAKYE